jgi:MFS family permease
MDYSNETNSTSADSEPPVGGPYSWYVLFVLDLVYVFNFIDRQILSILNEDIKADLGLTDAHMGFLFGTAFAVFYAIFGIPLGRLADMWVRKNMIAIGLFFWSLMTALSGTSRGFYSLAAFRIGVGIGESSASPAAFSMLGDYFPVRLRATAVAVYSSGVYIGAGVGMLIGGQVVERWNNAFPLGTDAPFGLVGWQAAFFAVGLPGLLMTLWAWTLKEPIRGRSEGLKPPPKHPAPFRALGRELAAVIPPFTIITLARESGSRAVFINSVIAVLCAGAAFGLTKTVGSPEQWIALGIGLYAFFSWVQALKYRDPATFAMIFATKSMMFGLIGFASCAFFTYGASYWAAPFFLRVHGESMATVGTWLGLTAITAGWFGVTAGGIISDWLKSRTPYGRIYCGLFAAIAPVPTALVLFTTPDVKTAYYANFLFTMFSSFWIGSAIALCNELVIPRMRGIASATYILVVTFIGLALGPFTIGRISTSLEQGGTTSGEALRTGILVGLGGYVVAVTFLLLSMRYLKADESSRLERARALGEAV